MDWISWPWYVCKDLVVGTVDRRTYIRLGWKNVRIASSFCQSSMRDCSILGSFSMSSSRRDSRDWMSGIKSIKTPRYW